MPDTYSATMNQEDGKSVARLSLMVAGVPKDLRAEGENDSEALEALRKRLRLTINTAIINSKVIEQLPPPAGAVVEIQPTPTEHDAEASKLLLDFAKDVAKEADANLQLAESRARQNGALALAVIPVMAFIRPAQTEFAFGLFAILVLVFVAVTLAFTVMASRSLEINAQVQTADLDKQKAWIFDGHMDIKNLRYLYQGVWIDTAAAYQQAAATRFCFVRAQAWSLGISLGLLAVLILLSLF